ncbi:MAG: glycosyltransferase family 2 protein [Chloroflexota bacterium]|nr:glycosyltransferase family 2 protein [Chloroflexota bacterium]
MQAPDTIATTNRRSFASSPPHLTPTTRLPEVVAVILNWNNLELTQDTLRSLQGQDYPRLRAVLLDNASRNQEETLSVIHEEFPHVDLWGSKRNLGFAGGCNLGMRIALEMGAEHVLLLNNDVLLEQDVVSRLVQALEEHEKVGAASPLVLYASEPGRVWFGGGSVRMGGRVLPEHLWLDEPPDHVPDVPAYETEWLAGTCMLVRRRAVEQVGLMDPAYFLYWEDVDWCYRLRAAGYRLLVVPGARIRHRVNATTGTLPSLGSIYYWERNRLRFIKKWGTRASLAAALVKVVWRSFAWRLRLPQDDPQASTKLEAYRDYLSGRFGQRRTQV